MSPSVAAVSSGGHTTPGYRRNGKLRACEPCRKKKLRCDHAVPVCGRCVAREQSERCIYHPQPLSRATEYGPRRQIRQMRRNPEISSRRPQVFAIETCSSPIQLEEPEQREPSGYAAYDEPLLGPCEPPTRESWPTQPKSPQQDSCGGKCGSQGFLGTTSHTAIFSEAMENFSPALTSSLVFNGEDTISEGEINHSYNIVAFLEDRNMVDLLIERWYEHSEGSCICPGFVMKQWLEQVWRHHDNALAGGHTATKWRLCESLWRNTRSPLLVGKATSASTWISRGTGENLRWQVIGLVAVVAGLCAACLSPSDVLFVNNKVIVSDFVNKMAEVSRACIAICRSCNAMDDLFVWLLYEHTRLVRAVSGEGSHDAYRAGGETNDALITMGLHQNTLVNDEVPFFLSELRKRLVVGIYAMEISTAVFLGRPTRLSHQYCSISPPLDLADEQLTLEGTDLEASLECLDLDGFNKGKRLSRTTWLKVWLPFDQLREEVLNLALGQYTRDKVLRQADGIQQRSVEQWGRLPSFLRKTQDELAEARMLKPVEVLFRTVLRQDYLSNELLLQRVLIQKTGASSAKLIGIAQEVLRDVLFITHRYDIASTIQTDLAFLLLIHGMRSGATIAVELLRQEKVASCPENAQLPRSQTIQDLSVFAARLGAVDSSSGAFRMCDQGRNAITSILNKILDLRSVQLPDCQQSDQQPPLIPIPQLHLDLQAQAPRSLDLGTCLVTEVDQNLEFEELVTLGNDHDFMRWLENADWGPSDS
ncbi:hypothetical protein EDB81DRAFT_439686 [Dactylonectria macrodidyma]|uniref:Zn(2)-C6 fungal-type domain-containing protein n=1 Tax=Dactylonectria macrodidyma TaxID=307937 RepID=A0A9P9F632_9HYPO|nr:hypothetical protein EDB81DRAFT_439686 [Dactylonectria macrodidyma]